MTKAPEPRLALTVQVFPRPGWLVPVLNSIRGKGNALFSRLLYKACSKSAESTRRPVF